MKKQIFLTSLFFLFLMEMAALIFFWAAKKKDTKDSQQQDTVLINEAIQSVQADWNTLKDHKNETGLDYVILDLDGTVLFKTKSGLSESINAAIRHRDTILDIQIDSLIVGNMIIYNDITQSFQSWKQTAIIILLSFFLMQCFICIAYIIYLNHTIIKPFYKLKGFAERIANGNLDIPLTMDRQNLFGAFTESFDIMRSELKKAKLAEQKPMQAKKSLLQSFPMILKHLLQALKQLPK